MLRTQTVEKGTLDLIKRFMSDDKFNDFNLAGGTALALRIGHRKSVDIDLFSTTPFGAKEQGNHFAKSYSATEVRTLTNGVFCFVDMYSLLEKFTLNELFGACQRKYPDLNINMVKHSLIHFDDIAYAPIDFIGPEIKWSIIADRLLQAFHKPYISFGLPENVKKLPENRGSISKGRRQGPKL